MKVGDTIKALSDEVVPVGTLGVIEGIKNPHWKGVTEIRYYEGVLVKFENYPISKVLNWDDAHNVRKFLLCNDKNPPEKVIEYKDIEVSFKIKVPVLDESTDTAFQHIVKTLSDDIGVIKTSIKLLE